MCEKENEVNDAQRERERERENSVKTIPNEKKGPLSPSFVITFCSAVVLRVL